MANQNPEQIARDNIDKQLNEFCEKHGFDGWFETSAKENINIEEAARSLVARVSPPQLKQHLPLLNMEMCII